MIQDKSKNSAIAKLRTYIKYKYRNCAICILKPHISLIRHRKIKRKKFKVNSNTHTRIEFIY